ncbi:MAG: class I SAM-dependent methyltransferase [Acidimicrobiales bacterium]
MHSGPYDRLYESRDDALWGPPGRLVLRAREWLAPGSRVYDAGCGDGKNALFLEESGFVVQGGDISGAAIERLRRRFTAAGRSRAAYVVEDVAAGASRRASFDCLVSYGLFHCMHPADRVAGHRSLQGCVRPGGLVLFSALLDSRPLPPAHLTPEVTLVAADEVEQLFVDHEILVWSTGTITESHEPLVPTHSHDAVWVVARRP